MDFANILDQLYLSLNEYRMHPKQSSHLLQSRKLSFHDNLYKDKFQTQEGINALQDLISHLKGIHPSKQGLKWSFALHAIADYQANILGQTGLLTLQQTAYQSELYHKIQQYAIIKGKVCEISEFGGMDAQQILEELLIDDGLANRKRRRCLLDMNYKYIGIGSCYHKKNNTCTVIILAEDVVDLITPNCVKKEVKKEIFRLQNQQNEENMADAATPEQKQAEDLTIKQMVIDKQNESSFKQKKSLVSYQSFGIQQSSITDSVNFRSKVGFPSLREKMYGSVTVYQPSSSKYFPSGVRSKQNGESSESISNSKYIKNKYLVRQSRETITSKINGISPMQKLDVNERTVVDEKDEKMKQQAEQQSICNLI